MPTALYSQEWQLHHLFQAQSNFGQGCYMFDNHYGAFFCDPAGQCGVLNGSGGTTVQFCLNLTWIPLHPYILSFCRASLDPDGNGIFEYYYVLRLEDLSTDVVQTETVPAGRVHDGAEHNFTIGRTANYWRDKVGSCLISMNGLNATEGDQARAWLKSYYLGEDTTDPSSGGDDGETAADEAASFFVELDIATS